MRRKSFDVLFDTKNGMAWLADHPTMWRSLFYFVISLGAFLGVCTNVFFKEEYIGVRFAILIGMLVSKAIGMVFFACFLHGLIDLCEMPQTEEEIVELLYGTVEDLKESGYRNITIAMEILYPRRVKL